MNARQGVFFKLLIRADTRFFLRHADVRLIDIQFFLRAEIGIRPVKGLSGYADLGVPLNGFGILHDVIGVQRDAVQFLAVVHNDRHDFLAVFQRVTAGEEEFPHAVVFLRHGMGVAVPAVKITGEIHGFGCRCPLTVIPAVFAAVDAEEVVAVRKVLEFLAGL